ncbi:hypothetical protein C0J52_02247 [Blattella germanica]|nr:hypothetical protein C0J52_02247 [Blattella germanica]
MVERSCQVASYTGPAGIIKVQPDWRLEEQFVVDSHQNALDVDSSDSSHPITCDVYSPAQINSIFDSISYDKGKYQSGSVIRMMEHFLTTKVFKEGLRNYLKAM